MRNEKLARECIPSGRPVGRSIREIEVDPLFAAPELADVVRGALRDSTSRHSLPLSSARTRRCVRGSDRCAGGAPGKIPRGSAPGARGCPPGRVDVDTKRAVDRALRDQSIAFDSRQFSSFS
jgi:hypothetical protein